MKSLIITAGIFMITLAAQAQTYMTRTGKVSFNASAPNSPEKVEAVNNETASILDSKTGGIVFQVPIKSFKFERELMQEHFNENYMESDRYPKGDFKGTISDNNTVNYSKDGTYNVKVTGKMTIHGVTKDVSVPGTITVKDKMVKASAKFSVKMSDYGISVPGVVADKVAKEAKITLESDMSIK